MVSRFTIPRFFQEYPKSVAWGPISVVATAPINTYPVDFDGISKRAREQRGWRCERCGRDFPRTVDQEYLHVHYKTE